jgi:predicted transcriptional regulator
MVGKRAAKGYHRLTVDLPLELYERLKSEAQRRRWPMRIVVQEALREHLDREEEGAE